MTFDPKSLLIEPPPPDLTVDDLVAVLESLQSSGFGAAGVRLLGGSPARRIELVAHGEEPAHILLTDGVPLTASQRTIN
nr:hypothetical protein [uncultured Duganella sp.]